MSFSKFLQFLQSATDAVHHFAEELPKILTGVKNGEEDAATWYRAHESSIRFACSLVGAFPVVGPVAKVVLELCDEVDACLKVFDEVKAPAHVVIP
jgi:hypothetical protein